MISADCSRFESRKPAPVIDEARFDRELRAAVQSAAQPEVWIRSPRPGGDPRSPSVTDVVLTGESFDRGLRAARETAALQGLAVHAQSRHWKSGRREVEARFALGRHVVSRWNFREVERIYRAAVIMDDLGNDPGAAKMLLALPYPLTFSVLPDLPHSVRTADEAHAHGREVMLHLPMEPEPGAPARPGPGEIKVGMTRAEVERMLEADLDSVPHAAGINNHMGSRATADAALMAAVMRVVARRRLFFVDSRTTAQSTALHAARRAGVPSFYRSVFLDDTETVDYTLGQLRLFRRDIEAQGAAIAIGHPHPSTIAALKRFLPELERDGIELVPASELVRLPETARLSPPAAHRQIEPDTH
jgi:polysaccharide deacetylase 2 family uncharacterized protein YibQ